LLCKFGNAKVQPGLSFESRLCDGSVDKCYEKNKNHERCFHIEGLMSFNSLLDAYEKTCSYLNS